MDRNPVRFPKDQTEQISWQWRAKAAVSWCIAASVAVFAWFVLRDILTLGIHFKPLSLGYTFGLALTQASLAVVLERGLAFTRLRQSWRYRLSFLISAGLAWVDWLILIALHAHFNESFPSLITLAGVPMVAIAGAFSGSLFVTGLNESFWEDNSPPLERVRLEVYQRHLERIRKPPATPLSKRLFDIVLALIGLVISMPLCALITFLLWLEDPGPILFIKNSVGKGGMNFHQFKFRTMVRGAEDATGPVLSHEGDQRVLTMGGFLRKTALDELPQLINILRGEMSFVGPRPQRTVLVHSYLEKLPEYAERHLALPGLSGLAQVAGDYYLTPRQKLRFDRLYIRHSSIGFDLKLLWLAFMITFWFRWHKNWNGRLPRRFLRFGGISRP